jgi:hypothetical protein
VMHQLDDHHPPDLIAAHLPGHHGRAPVAGDGEGPGVLHAVDRIRLPVRRGNHCASTWRGVRALGGGPLDEGGHGRGLRNVDRVAAADLDDLGARALGHQPLAATESSCLRSTRYQLGLISTPAWCCTAQRLDSPGHRESAMNAALSALRPRRTTPRISPGRETGTRPGAAGSAGPALPAEGP